MAARSRSCWLPIRRRAERSSLSPAPPPSAPTAFCSPAAPPPALLPAHSCLGRHAALGRPACRAPGTARAAPGGVRRCAPRRGAGSQPGVDGVHAGLAHVWVEPGCARLVWERRDSPPGPGCPGPPAVRAPDSWQDDGGGGLHPRYCPRAHIGVPSVQVAAPLTVLGWQECRQGSEVLRSCRWLAFRSWWGKLGTCTQSCSPADACAAMALDGSCARRAVARKPCAATPESFDRTCLKLLTPAPRTCKLDRAFF